MYLFIYLFIATLFSTALSAAVVTKPIVLDILPLI